VVDAGAAEFSVETSHERADAGELFVLEPDAVRTGMAAVPEGWTYKVLYSSPTSSVSGPKRTQDRDRT
jgi:hypothetical protein